MEPKCTRPTGLMDLPQELRDHIYGYLMVKQKTTITTLPHYGCFQSPISAAQPALCCVNKQIREETLPIFYDTNIFLAELSDADDLAVAKQWISAVGDDNIRLVRKLALCGWTMVSFAHSRNRLWIRAVFDLKDGALEIEGNEAKVDEHSHVVKDAKELKALYHQMVELRAGEPFDGKMLEVLMDGFHTLCVL